MSRNFAIAMAVLSVPVSGLIYLAVTTKSAAEIEAADAEYLASGRAREVVRTEPSRVPTTATSAAPTTAANAGDGDAGAVASTLGVGSSAEALLSTIASRYGVSVEEVGDRAAKSGQLCVGDDVGRYSKVVAASLEFVAGVSKTAEERERMSLNEAFVTYVATGCPE